MFRFFGMQRLGGSCNSVEKLGYQLIQQCSVSGTPKGKKKALPVKKKTDAKKSGSSGKYRKAGVAGDLDEMASKCVKTPTPKRFMRLKDRAREAEREKLGLISKERQREMALLKKQAKEGEKPSVETPGWNFISLGLVDVDALQKYELTVEDGRRLAKEYSRVLMRRHRSRQKAEATVLRLKKEAIEALPEHLKAAALVPDLTPLPASRFFATLTPPIEGYIEKMKEAAAAAEQGDGKEKRRRRL